MDLTTAYEAAGVVLAVLALLGAFAAIQKWFFKRGADEKAVTVALNANTAAVERLTGQMEGVKESLHDFRHQVDQRFNEFDVRLTKVEAPVHVHVSTSSDRNASSQS